MTVGFPSGKKKADIDSPWNKENIRRIARGSYSSLASSVVSSARTKNCVIAEMSQLIKKEMKNICSESHDSVIRDSQEGIKHFSWDTIWLELVSHMPTLVKLLSTLCPDEKASQKIVTVIICMLLKKTLGKMSMVQKALSVLLYGNGCNKKV